MIAFLFQIGEKRSHFKPTLTSATVPNTKIPGVTKQVPSSQQIYLIVAATDYEIQITNYELQIINYELQITNYKLRITNYGLREKQKRAYTNYYSKKKAHTK